MPTNSEPPANEPGLPLSIAMGRDGGAADVRAAQRSGGEGSLADEVTQTVILAAGVALHARPAADLVRAASRLQTQVAISANGKRASARSILEVLALGAVDGTELTLSASGPGADDAVRTLTEIIASLGA